MIALMFYERDTYLLKYLIKYRMRAIITRGLYIFYPILEDQKRFFKEVFS